MYRFLLALALVVLVCPTTAVTAAPVPSSARVDPFPSTLVYFTYLRGQTVYVSSITTYPFTESYYNQYYSDGREAMTRLRQRFMNALLRDHGIDNMGETSAGFVTEFGGTDSFGTVESNRLRFIQANRNVGYAVVQISI